MFYRNVSECFLLSVRRSPKRTALVFGEQRYTYEEANKRINRIANSLSQLGVKSGDKVAFLFPNCCEIVLIYYAIQKIGAVAVPLNFRLIPREIGFLAENSDSGTLIFAAEYAEKVKEAPLPQGMRLLPLSRSEGFSLSLEELEAESTDEEPALFLDETAVSRIQFTGGSTGVRWKAFCR